MGREVKRVAFGFDWPLNKVWEGYLNPHYDHCIRCALCNGDGSSDEGRLMQDRWYGNAPFSPEENSSVPFKWYDPAILQFSKRQLEREPEYYGVGEAALRDECERITKLYNSRWQHHLNELDVQALLDDDRLWDFTRRPQNQEEIDRIGQHSNGWLKDSNGRVPTPLEVNTWSLNGMGHDSINSWVVINAAAKRHGINTTCKSCKGEGTCWDSDANQAKAEAWTKTEPSAGEGWQFWENVTEGSPQSPVFATREELVTWLMENESYSFAAADGFTKSGYAPSMVIADGVIYQNGESGVLHEDAPLQLTAGE